MWTSWCLISLTILNLADAAPQNRNLQPTASIEPAHIPFGWRGGRGRPWSGRHGGRNNNDQNNNGDVFSVSLAAPVSASIQSDSIQSTTVLIVTQQVQPIPATTDPCAVFSADTLSSITPFLCQATDAMTGATSVTSSTTVPITSRSITSDSTAPTLSQSSITAPLETTSPTDSLSNSPQLQNASPFLPAPSPAFTSNPNPHFLRGVNLGGWLVLEKWMTPDLFTGPFTNAVDQWTFDSTPGAYAALQAHWSTYYTTSDIAILSSHGINALRIPIGYWAYDNTSTPYLLGASSYLDLAITWARTYNMKVWIDLHGAPGSQNGFDNSGHAGAVEWQQGSNLARTLDILKEMAGKYGGLEYADVVVALELVNEPISWGANSFQVTKSWAAQAYPAIRAAAANPKLRIVMHDAFEGPLAWEETVKSVAGDGGGFGIDTHLYQAFTDADNTLSQDQHITQACAWAGSLSAANKLFPVYVGEWSASTNICVNPDGTSTSGTSCAIQGCQCQSADPRTWNQEMVQLVRRFVEVQMDVFESASSGWFMWSAKAPGAWGFLNGVEGGWIPGPVTEREFPGQCGGDGDGGGWN